MKKLIFLPLLLLFAGCGVAASSRPVAPAASPVASRTVEVPKPKTFVPDRVIASRSGQINFEDVDLDLTHLERTGQTISLSMRLSTDAVLSPEIGKTFDDGTTQAIEQSGSEENGDSVDGVYLVDRTHAQKYLVARDPDGRCICDVGIGKLIVSERPLTLSATYGAPPPEVTAVDVVVPHFGAFANVPLG